MIFWNGNERIGGQEISKDWMDYKPLAEVANGQQIQIKLLDIDID